jgi:hypothetical protein
MTRYLVFNGDADGLCSLQQLRLAEPGDSTLVTGVKRDIDLLRHVHPAVGDSVTALDISLERNRLEALRLLAAGARLRYFDHHRAAEMPPHPRFEPYIDESANACTSVLVDRYVRGRHRAWAAVGAFGDGLRALGARLARDAGVDTGAITELAELGTRLNYNAYGEALADLHYDPRALAETMHPFADPLDFIRECPVHESLGAYYDDDMRRARAWPPFWQVPGATIVILPAEAWARRTIGALANERMLASPDCAIAILTPNVGRGFTVSVRVPPGSVGDAGAFCRRFETGGGRKLAAGINDLPGTDLDRFSAQFASRFGRQSAL